MNHMENLQLEINEGDNITQIIEYIKKLKKKNLKCYKNTMIPLSNKTEKETEKIWNQKNV